MDPGAVIRKFDQARAKHPDMVLVHGGAGSAAPETPPCPPHFSPHGSMALPCGFGQLRSRVQADSGGGHSR